MRHFGIIGFPLEHSFSAELFTRKFAAEGIDAEYAMYPLESIGELPHLLARVPLCGLNVTMPYKRAVIPYLDALDPIAEALQAVNVIRIQDGRTTGYNTDVIGFVEAIRGHLRPHDHRALVLGTGGAASAVRYGLEELGLEVTLVSRNAERGIPYEALDAEVMRQHTVIVNATPLGMYPHTEKYPPIPYHLLTEAHFLYDVIYNPEQTLFLQKGQAQGARIQGGMGMLLGQAIAAWEIWDN